MADNKIRGNNANHGQTAAEMAIDSTSSCDVDSSATVEMLWALAAVMLLSRFRVVTLDDCTVDDGVAVSARSAVVVIATGLLDVGIWCVGDVDTIVTLAVVVVVGTAVCDSPVNDGTVPPPPFDSVAITIEVLVAALGQIPGIDRQRPVSGTQNWLAATQAAR